MNYFSSLYTIYLQLIGSRSSATESHSRYPYASQIYERLFVQIFLFYIRDKLRDVSNCDVLPSCLRPSDFLPYSFDIHHERQPFLSLLKTLLKDMKVLITVMLSDIYLLAKQLNTFWQNEVWNLVYFHVLLPRKNTKN